MRKLKDLNIKKGDKVLLRADFNVVLEDGAIADDFRIKATLPTIKYLQEKECRILIVSHLGRPEGQDPSKSLKPIAKHLEELLGKKVSFFESYSKALEGVVQLEPGGVSVLENIRFDPRETKGSEEFAQELSRLGDIYVNDAFGAAHRKHTSVYYLPQAMDSAAGLLLEKEVDVLNEIRNPKERPLVFILGGAKVHTKLKTLVELIDVIDAACLGGLMANTILEQKGYMVGRSEREEDADLKGLDITSTKLHLPLDVVVAKDTSEESATRVTGVGNIQKDEMVLDAGPETVELFSKIIKDAGTIVWNGPLGLMEVDKYQKGTFSLARALKGISANIIVGGGDIMLAIDEAGVEDDVDYASTGGGAMLEYLAEGTLPALEVL